MENFAANAKAILKIFKLLLNMYPCPCILKYATECLRTLFSHNNEANFRATLTISQELLEKKSLTLLRIIRPQKSFHSTKNSRKIESIYRSVERRLRRRLLAVKYCCKTFNLRYLEAATRGVL